MKGMMKMKTNTAKPFVVLAAEVTVQMSFGLRVMYVKGGSMGSALR